jgi:DNA helicase-2/ATP-dependent DNA helicase PcrA
MEPRLFYADLHIHSRFSLATSKALNPFTLAQSAQRKGIELIGTGDLTHPAWLGELEKALSLAPNGFYRLKGEDKGTFFVPTGEVSCIYKQDGKTRKIHLVIVTKDLKRASKISSNLGARGNINSDGRPIFGMSARDITEIVLTADPDAIVFPAHVWTPWFSLFGSMSGFDSLEECFKDLSHHIKVLETGLSSDPYMNRLLSSLDSYGLVSSSDAHSPEKLGREATILNGPVEIGTLWDALCGGDSLYGTVEFFPEEGKYHLDGHANCGPALTPKETKKYKGLCPVCGKPLTIGVLNRVMELSDRSVPPEELMKPDYHIFPLIELLGQVLGKSTQTVGVRQAYEKLMTLFPSEYHLLLTSPLQEIEEKGGSLLRLGVERMRKGEVSTQAGYDGLFGIVEAIGEEDRLKDSGAGRLIPLGEGKKRAVSRAPLQKEPALGPNKEKPQKKSRRDPISVLNEAQYEAVTHPGSSLLILAGPGSGKTRVLITRAQWFLEKGIVAPSELLLTTFTRKAAEELEERMVQFSKGVQKGIRVGTLHSLAFEILALCGHRLKLAPKELLKELGEKLSQGTPLSPKRFLTLISRFKNLVKAPNCAIEGFEHAYNRYEEHLKDLGLLDFDDLIIKAKKIVEEEKLFPAKAILADEAQDLSQLQYNFLSALAQSANFTVIGDPAQSIYGFRGAISSIEETLRRDRQDLAIRNLPLNYRCPGVISRLSELFRDQGGPVRQTIKPKGKQVVKAILDSPQGEALYIARRIKEHLGTLELGKPGVHKDALKDLSFGDIAVIFRLRVQGEELLKTLVEEGIPCQISGEDEVEAQDGLDLKAEKISLITMHAAKGLEFRLVFATGLEDGLFPIEYSEKNSYFLNEQDQAKEEERLFYVAITRSKELLYLTRARRRRLYGKFLSGKASPFWDRIPKELVKEEREYLSQTLKPEPLF